MSQLAESLTEKLQTLLDHPDQHLVQAAATLSQPSLTRIWDNPEDDVYDNSLLETS